MCININPLPFSADVLGGSVNEPLEPGGDGEEGPRELPHPLTTDHQEDQRGEKTKAESRIYCPLTVTEWLP